MPICNPEIDLLQDWPLPSCMRAIYVQDIDQILSNWKQLVLDNAKQKDEDSDDSLMD